MPTPLALIALIAFPWSHPAASGEVSHIAGWTVRAHLERFTGAKVCSITRPRLSVERQALVVRLPRKVDTSAAVYRVDRGAPIQAKDDAAELAGQGFALHDDDLQNPSGGKVRIPLRRLAGAKTLAIETAADQKRPASFRIDGLDTALEAARKADCR